MPELLDLEVVTPERELVHEAVTEVQIPARDGYLGILPGHAPLVSELGTGSLSYSARGHKRSLSVQGGFVEVLPDHVRVLANTAERAEEIDVERAREEMRRAQEQLADAALGVDPAIALDALAWAQAKVETVERNGH
ncbi:MAG TPA: ATP synthase F1 subunit epsilon [Bryobacteraceae bacterium]|jgi:F-type H+-transporting ATPase subunit epsilon|nr:ATP synthase F1 subunit epsilon [Bryobacteraceae bacterium]